MKNNNKKRISQSVVYWKKRELRITKKILKYMKYQALHNEKNRFRYCFHKNENALIHQMLFTITRNSYIRPHCHNEDEFQVVIAGKAYVIYFDDKGNIKDLFMSSSHNNNIYRIRQGTWHMNVPVSKTITILEVKKGPFNAGSNEYPLWAPLPEDKENTRKFMRKIKQGIVRYRLLNVIEK